MNIPRSLFDRESKHLAKKFRSFAGDYERLLNDLRENPNTVVHLLTIYDKSEISNIDVQDLRILKAVLYL